ncbi:MAG: DEAD/DEAH box helicase [Methylococcales bacterium]|jgi:superfamily II DNA or RNA helicase|nr:DEAD/DEAH box helicase [Methylococcales bacterium]MBT7443455.1 DEAD/DEAH box helicase [Methylococcales bacterium]
MKIRISGTLEIQNPTEPVLANAKQINTHRNPKYEQARQNGRSTYNIETNIEDYVLDDDGTLTLPRGCFKNLAIQPEDYELTDQQTLVPITLPTPNFTLRGYQEKTLSDIDQQDSGVIVAPTGSGKTVIGIQLIANRQQKTLVLVHTKELLNQWRERISAAIASPIESIGIIGSGKWKEGEQITIGMIQTLTRNLDKVAELNYGLVIIDECHHLPAASFAKVMDTLPAKYRYGLSATPKRRDGLENMLYNRIGPKLAEIDKAVVEDVGGIITAQVKVFHTGIDVFVSSWADFLTEIIESDERNIFIANLAIKAAKKMPILILTDRVSHAEKLHAMTGGVLLHGQLKKSEREAGMQATESAAITIGTTSLLGEGVDVAGWQGLILATPLSGQGRLLQAIGRVIRPKEGKTMGFIADFVDECGFSVSSFRKRLAVYQDRGYLVGYAE